MRAVSVSLTGFAGGAHVENEPRPRLEDDAGGPALKLRRHDFARHELL